MLLNAGRRGDRASPASRWRPTRGPSTGVESHRLPAIARPDDAGWIGQPARRPRGRPAARAAICADAGRASEPRSSLLAAGADPSPRSTSRAATRASAEPRRARRRLPLVGAVGLLTDLADASVGAGSDGARALRSPSWRPRTPRTRCLDRAGRRRPARERSRSTTSATTIGAAAGADQARVYAADGRASALLVALLALVAGVARHLRSYRHDVAVAARRSGSDWAPVRRAVGRAGRSRRRGRARRSRPALLAVQLLLDGLPLVDAPAGRDARSSRASVLPALVTRLALAAIVVLVVGGRARAVRPRRDPSVDPARGRGATR